jgi:hypothetical protein
LILLADSVALKVLELVVYQFFCWPNLDVGRFAGTLVCVMLAGSWPDGVSVVRDWPSIIGKLNDFAFGHWPDSGRIAVGR